MQGTPEDSGVLPRTLDVLFNSIQPQHYAGTPVYPKFYSDVAFLEPAEHQQYLRLKDESLASHGTKVTWQECFVCY